MTIRFDNRVVLVTGAGAGLGREHALMFAERGAKLVINDLGGGASGGGSSSAAADAVVDEIRAMGGEAVASYDSVEQGDKIVQTAIDAFGRLDVVVNNAGILRDKTFANMTDDDWDLVYRVHMLGAYKVSHAAWPHMRAQNYGRIINTASCAMYGNFGQANYAAVKSAMVGFTRTLANEGAKYGINANVIMPLANSQMLETIFPKEICEKLDAKSIAALVVKLCSEESQESAGTFEVGGGWVSKVRYQRSRGAVLDGENAFNPDAIAEAWDQVVDFGEADYPLLPIDSMTRAFEVIGMDASQFGLEKGVNLK